MDFLSIILKNAETRCSISPTGKKKLLLVKPAIMEFTIEQIRARLAQIKELLAKQYRDVNGQLEPIEDNKIELYQMEIQEITKLYPDLEFGDDISAEKGV